MNLLANFKNNDQMKQLVLHIWIMVPFVFLGQHSNKSDSVRLIFMGDIMGHEAQIQSAYQANTGKYNYDDAFKKVSHIIETADFAIANLELTLAGKPYSGYPQFSSPDELANACLKGGIDVLVTANNHSCDRGLKGINRTIDVLDSMKIPHTGTFKNDADRQKNNVIILERNSIKIGILNYTYGTNGISIPPPSIVNLLDTVQIKADLLQAKNMGLDKLIAFVHWGTEYELTPSINQRQLAQFFFQNGVDIIVGAHPHVIQKMEFNPSQDQVVAYSLGNFISNQRTRRSDGGAMLELVLTKTNQATKISEVGYRLVWVNKPIINGKSKFELVLCKEQELSNFKNLDGTSKNAIKTFISDSRLLFNSENVNVKEIKR